VTAGGIEAFELVSRYDRYDYLDTANGGVAESSTLGLNWYKTQWSRLMLDVVHWRTNNKVGSFKGLDDGDSLGLRGQLAL
jgi:phosphate-selective porin OprO/OprP